MLQGRYIFSVNISKLLQDWMKDLMKYFYVLILHLENETVFNI